MALQWQQMASIENHGAYVDVEYDDVSRIAQTLRWANTLNVPVLVFVNAEDGTSLLNTIMPPNTAEATRNIPNNKRWNIDTGGPSVNLSS